MTDIGNRILAAADADPELVSRVVSFLKDSPARYKGNFIPFSLSPDVFDDYAKSLFEETAADFSMIIGRTLERFIVSPEFRGRFAIDDKLFELMERLASGIPDGCAREAALDAASFLRFDCLYSIASGAGAVEVCEVNSNALGGIAESHFVEQAIELQPVFKQWKSERNLMGFGTGIYDIWADRMISRCKMRPEAFKHAKALGEKPHFAFLVLFDSGSLDSSELLHFKKYFDDQGMDFSIVDVRHLRVDEDGYFYGDEVLFGKAGKPIDFSYNYLIYSDIVRHEGECSDFLSNLDSSNTDLFPSPLCFLIQDKNFISVLQGLSEGDNCNAMTDGCKSSARQGNHRILRTYGIGAGNADDMMLNRFKAHRREYVLKPSSSYAGMGVVFGSSCDQKEWEALVDAAAKGRKGEFIIQEIGIDDGAAIIPVSQNVLERNRKFSLKHARRVVGLFSICGEFAGVYVRAGFGDVVSSADSSYSCASYYHSEKA